LLEHPQYTRPYDWEGIKPPEVLLSGNHGEIEKWRNKKSVEDTKKRRPELLFSEK
jgi:tRNA (guanine37-N1)-methyltransferase